MGAVPSVIIGRDVQVGPGWLLIFDLRDKSVRAKPTSEVPGMGSNGDPDRLHHTYLWKHTGNAQHLLEGVRWTPTGLKNLAHLLAGLLGLTAEYDAELSSACAATFRLCSEMN